MDIVGKAKKLERKIARSLDAAVGEFVGSSAPAPLEIIYQVLDRAEHEVQHSGRGQRIFPFNRLAVHVVAPKREPHARARFSAICDGPPSLAERLHTRLEAAGCRAPSVTVEIVFASKPGAHWETPHFQLEFHRDERPAAPLQPVPAPVPATPVLKLTVVQGKAAHRTYAFTGGRIDIGRRAEVLDAKHRLIRTNHLAFDEEGHDANATVSRRHAHVLYDGSRHEYRLLDDRSAHGTGIIRHGRTITVHPGSRGVRLENGDEILVGQARLRVAIAPIKGADTDLR